MLFNYFNKPHNNHGFTLFELVVSVSIAASILAVIVYNQRAYNDKSELINQADKIGLTLTEAQVYGMGVRELSVGSNEFDTPYGIAFSLENSGEEVSYIYFADHNGNKKYDGDWSCPVGAGLECLAKFNMPDGNHVDSVCAVSNAGVSDCTLVKRADISFVRPNAAAHISFIKPSGNILEVPGIIGVSINLKSPQDNTRSVKVYSTGQISVQ